MKKLTLLAAALGCAATSAIAADLAGMPTKAPVAAPAAAPNPFDIAFGAAVMSDYNFRGISQSNRKPSVAAYFEPRWNIAPNWQLYAGVAGESINFPNRAGAEIDFYAGVRPTVGPFAFDFGGWYYYYPGGRTFDGLGPTNLLDFSNASCTNGFVTPTGFCNALKGDVSYWEVFGKVTYTVVDGVALGGNVFYSPSWLNSGADGTYASATAKFTAPSSWLPSGIGAYVSGELGHYWFGTTDAFYGTPAFPNGIKLPDYTTWNLGVGLTYKVFTLDLRYYDTDASRANCNVLTGAHTATFNAGNISATNPSGLGTNWCGSTFIAKLSADLTLDNLK